MKISNILLENTNLNMRVNIKGDFESEGEIIAIKKDAEKKGFDVKFHATEPTNYFDFNVNHLQHVKDLLTKHGFEISSIRNIEGE